MIVNTAYPYMKKKEKPANPNLWENGAVNYPYTTTGGANFQAENNRFWFFANSTVTITIPTKSYTKIKFVLQAATYAGCWAKISIPSGNVLLTKSLGQTAMEIEVAIPSASISAGSAELEIECTVNQMIALSATLI